MTGKQSGQTQELAVLRRLGFTPTIDREDLTAYDRDSGVFTLRVIHNLRNDSLALMIGYRSQGPTFYRAWREPVVSVADTAANFLRVVDAAPSRAVE